MPAYKVLLVEDDSRVRVAVRLCMESLGYSVCEAGTGAEALTLAEGQQPDLILLDLVLPDGDGLAVAQELRRRPSTARIPIAIFTGQVLSGRRAEVVASISVGSIPKPVTLERLGRDLRLLLTMRRTGARRFPRYPVEAPVWWRFQSGSDSPQTDYAAGVARTISEGGLMLELPTLVAVASLLDLRLPILGSEITAVGKVVWSRFPSLPRTGGAPFQHGVQFTDVAPEILGVLQDLMGETGSAAR